MSVLVVGPGPVWERLWVHGPPSPLRDTAGLKSLLRESLHTARVPRAGRAVLYSSLLVGRGRRRGLGRGRLLLESPCSPSAWSTARLELLGTLGMLLRLLLALPLLMLVLLLHLP